MCLVAGMRSLGAFVCCNHFNHRLSQYNSNSNWTFIVLNLPYSKGTLSRNKTINSQPISVSRGRKKSNMFFTSLKKEFTEFLLVLLHYNLCRNGVKISNSKLKLLYSLLPVTAFFFFFFWGGGGGGLSAYFTHYGSKGVDNVSKATPLGIYFTFCPSNPSCYSNGIAPSSVVITLKTWHNSGYFPIVNYARW